MKIFGETPKFPSKDAPKVNIAGKPFRVPSEGIRDLDTQLLREKRAEAAQRAKAERKSDVVPPVSPAQLFPDPGPEGNLFTEEQLSPHRNEKWPWEEGQPPAEDVDKSS